jgi:triacylglycerol lipase
MVPGFAGFDALGQLEYYAGITPLFRAWPGRESSSSVLHYFDGLPSAGVRARARRLRAYLAKRVARGELQPGDRVCLVGHSTGGLDIRQLILDLDRENEGNEVDGARSRGVDVPASVLLELLERVVFLSVPQLGTNIADWVVAHALERKVLLAQARQLVGVASRVAAADSIESWAAGSLARLTGADILRAVQDALRELSASAGSPRSADAFEAAAELGLWLRLIDADFAVIQDLAALGAPDSASPAHRDARQRERELGLWQRWGIRTLSYATLGARVFDLPPGEVLPPWRPWSPFGWREPEALGAQHDTDPFYRLSYRACAGGPFECSPDIAQPPELVDGTPVEAIEAWDNDGIVNTASMLWPHGEATRLIRCDHADIIGHFELVAAPEGSGRAFHTYDLLGSGSRRHFTRETLRQVWEQVFDFCGNYSR